MYALPLCAHDTKLQWIRYLVGPASCPPCIPGRYTAAAWRPHTSRRGTGSTWAHPARTPRSAQSQSPCPRQRAARPSGQGPHPSTHGSASSHSLQRHDSASTMVPGGQTACRCSKVHEVDMCKFACLNGCGQRLLHARTVLSAWMRSCRHQHWDASKAGIHHGQNTSGLIGQHDAGLGERWRLSWMWAYQCQSHL